MADKYSFIDNSLVLNQMADRYYYHEMDLLSTTALF